MRCVAIIAAWITAVCSVLGDGVILERIEKVNDGMFSDYAGTSVAALGDVNGRGFSELAVSVPGAGRIWIVSFNQDGSIFSLNSERPTEWGGLTNRRDLPVAAAGDVDGDGIPDLLAGLPTDGELWLLFLDATTDVRSATLVTSKPEDANYARSLASLGDLDGDGISEVVVGADYFCSILFLNADGTVRSERNITEGFGGFYGRPRMEWFGQSVAAIGDVNGDTIPDMAVTSDNGYWILHLASDGLVIGERFVDAGVGFPSALAPPILSSLGDWNGDGVEDIGLGAPFLDDEAGALGLQILSADGSPSDVWTLRGLDGLTDHDDFGISAVMLGELAPGTRWLAAGVPGGNASRGAFWLLSLGCGEDDCDGDGVFDLCEADCDGDGTVDDCQLLSDPSLDCDGNGVLDSCDLALMTADDCDGNGRADACDISAGLQIDVWPPGGDGIPDSCQVDCNGNQVPDASELIADPDLDCNGNGLPDDCEIAAGLVADYDLDGVPDTCPVRRVRRISNFYNGMLDLRLGQYGGLLQPADAVWIGDLDDNGTDDIALGTIGVGDRPEAVMLVFRQADGSVLGHAIIEEGSPGFDVDLSTFQRGDDFGRSIASLGDLDGDGVPDLAIGASERASVFLCLMNRDGTVKDYEEITGLSTGDFGSALAPLGDVDGDGVEDLAVGANSENGELAVWVLLLNSDATVKSAQRIGVSPEVFQYDLARIGDLNNDGIRELVLGRWRSTEIQILFLKPDGTLLSTNTTDVDAFGAVELINFAGVGDQNNDGVPDLVVSDALPTAWTVFLDAEGNALGAVTLDPPIVGDAESENPAWARLDSRQDPVTSQVELLASVGGYHAFRTALFTMIMKAPPCPQQPLCDASLTAPYCDCDMDGVVDACSIDAGQMDCNGNGVLDACDLQNGVPDCDQNGIPDQCDATDIQIDCDQDGQPDACQIDLGAADCNGNLTLDDCEIANGLVSDSMPPGGDGIPDDCQNDCDGNQIPDLIDLANGAPDCNGNGIPDACDIALGESDDCDRDAQPDECQGAFDFSTQGYLSVASDAGLSFGVSDEITIEAWVRLFDGTGTQTIVAKNRAAAQNYYLKVADGFLRFGFRGAADTQNYEYNASTGVLPIDQWAHVAVTYAFGTDQAVLYVNAVPVDGAWNVSPSEGANVSSALLRVGAEWRANTASARHYFDGRLDELRIFRRVMSPNEVGWLRSGSVDPQTLNAVAIWRFDDGPGRPAYDQVSDRVATSVGGSAWVPAIRCDCPGDVDLNGVVQLDDLAIVLQQFGLVGAWPADLNRDGMVDIGDLGEVLGNYAASCTP